MNVNTELKARNVLIVTVAEIQKGDELWVMLSSDRHHDNVNCNRKEEKADLELAKERNALIIDAGDVFCAMQGKYDPRSDMNFIRPEDVGTNYLDRILEHAVEDYSPYAKNFLLIGKGNHETNILKRHGVCLTSRLTYGLNINGGNVYTGFIGGWVIFSFSIGGKRFRRSLKYHHGAGTNSPVTRGVIHTNRQAVYLPDADIVLNGHNHQGYHVPIARERVNEKYTIIHDVVHFIRTPGYKDAYGDGAEGWENEKAMAPVSVGCAWVSWKFGCNDFRETVTEDVR